MTSIRKSLLQFIFSGSYMKRWNDKLRPMELLEVDKQAHKMIVAWLLFELYSRRLPPAERLELGGRIVEGGLFDYFYRLVITDIKPPVFYKIKENPEHYRRLTDWVLRELEPRVSPLGRELWGRLEAWLSLPCGDEPARRILDAAHVFVSSYEFSLIKGINPFDEELEGIEAWFRDSLAAHADLPGVDELIQGQGSTLGRFARICGQLRFQKRWSQTPRIPETSVLGHMFIVAAYAYFFGLAVDACPARAQNDFFAGLFHDLPELLTRDIISPVKKSSPSIAELIRQYEADEFENRVLALLRQGGHGHLAERLAYLLGVAVGSEFACTIIENGAVRAVSCESLQAEYNDDRFDPKDGDLLKVTDSLAAFIEAYTAVKNGISSDQLQQALWRLRGQHQQTTLFGRLHVGALLADFD